MAQDAQTYTTRDEAVDREILAALAGGYHREAMEQAALDYDVPAIAEAVIEQTKDGAYRVRPDVNFWTVAEAHTIPDREALSEELRAVADQIRVAQQELRILAAQRNNLIRWGAQRRAINAAQLAKLAGVSQPTVYNALDEMS